jgi:hypothetical protein
LGQEAAMGRPGFEETQAPYAPEDLQALVGQVRRFGPDGPAYEIMAIDDAGRVHVEVIHSDEKVVCTVTEVLGDPIAETIP